MMFVWVEVAVCRVWGFFLCIFCYRSCSRLPGNWGIRTAVTKV